MIYRLWRGWTTPRNADAYERLLDRVSKSTCHLILLNGPSLSQQSHRSPLTRAAK